MHIVLLGQNIKLSFLFANKSLLVQVLNNRMFESNDAKAKRLDEEIIDGEVVSSLARAAASTEGEIWWRIVLWRVKMFRVFRRRFSVARMEVRTVSTRSELRSVSPACRRYIQALS